MDTDVLIVGGGPTGLVLALELARRGITPRIVDKAAGFFGGSRADGLSPRTQEVFADLGIIDTVLAEGDLGIQVRGYRNGEVIFTSDFAEKVPPRPDVPYANLWFLPQFRTEQLLRERLATFNIRVELCTEFTGLSQDDDGVTATLANGDVIRTRYLIGADGGRSTVRKLLHIPFPGETDDAIQVLFADVRLTGLDRDHGRVFMTDDGRGVVLMPLAGSDLFTLTCLPPADGDATLDYLQHVVTDGTGRDDIVLTEVTWSTVWRANARLAERFRDGRVFLIGDAAHVCQPTGGQGMNTGIQDAYNLGWKLAATITGTPADLLDTYQPERRPAAADAIALADKLLEKHKRGDADADKRREEVHQLAVNYRGGPLSVDHATAGIHAGDRAPDAPCHTADGRPTTLHTLFHGPHWTALAFGTQQAESTDFPRYTIGGSIIDTDGHIADAYGAPAGTIMLVRPDGYVGLTTTDPADVEKYLAQF